jgi:hypothetical protein
MGYMMTRIQSESSLEEKEELIIDHGEFFQRILAKSHYKKI